MVEWKCVCVFNLSLCLQPMDTEGEVQFRPRTGKAATVPLIPEVEAYLQLLLLVYLINNKRYTEVGGTGGCVCGVYMQSFYNSHWCVCNFIFSVYFQAKKVSDDLLQKISSQNRRALDLVAAKCYYYYCRVYEFLNQLDTVRR